MGKINTKVSPDPKPTDRPLDQGKFENAPSAKKNMWGKTFQEAQRNVTLDWIMQAPEVVLKQLKNKKPRDPLGFSNELFKPKSAEDELKIALHKMSKQI